MTGFRYQACNTWRVVVVLIMCVWTWPKSTIAQSGSSLLNPEISVNIAATGGYSTRNDTVEEAEGLLLTGFSVQEVDFTFGANADPYFRLDVVVAGHGHGGQLSAEFEEAYLSTTSLPDVTLRLGKLRSVFGVETQRHAHARRFINAPLPVLHLFATDHTMGTGVSVEYLAPFPFFTELKLQALHADWTGGAHLHGADESGTPPPEPADSSDDEAHPFTYVGHLKTSFELGESTTLDLGASGLMNTDEHGHWQHAWGADLRLKWVPAASARYTSFEWLTEYMSAQYDAGGRDGLYTGVRYKRAQQWWFQLRAALLDLATDAESRTYRGEAMIAFAPSERTAIRLQYGLEGVLEDEHNEGNAASAEHAHADELVHECFLQFIVSIGAHPAHED